MERDEVIEADVRRHVEKLEEFCDRIMACRVVIDHPHAHRRRGNLYHVRIDLTIPRHELVATRSPDEAHQHEDVHVAIRDAFDALRRRLQDAVRERRQQVKRHEPPALGRVTQIFPLADYGFLMTPDGREIYFHRHSVLDGGFDRLDIGSEVRFVEEEGERGPQASTVHVVRAASSVTE
jgi:cold shock CspA family protein/ribosome-associated translation inhibitor RaiA